jgi:hypothetical protein
MDDLLRLKMSPKENLITQEAMESTGNTGNRYSTYWKIVLT